MSNTKLNPVAEYVTRSILASFITAVLMSLGSSASYDARLAAENISNPWSTFFGISSVVLMIVCVALVTFGGLVLKTNDPELNKVIVRRMTFTRSLYQVAMAISAYSFIWAFAEVNAPMGRGQTFAHQLRSAVENPWGRCFLMLFVSSLILTLLSFFFTHDMKQTDGAEEGLTAKKRERTKKIFRRLKDEDFRKRLVEVILIGPIVAGALTGICVYTFAPDSFWYPVIAVLVLGMGWAFITNWTKNYWFLITGILGAGVPWYYVVELSKLDKTIIGTVDLPQFTQFVSYMALYFASVLGWVIGLGVYRILDDKFDMSPEGHLYSSDYRD